ncbi:CobQ/CobB/MinD/ParA nucleotide binding domain protein [Bacteriovorax sp. BSW11_IV]|uniref:ParA family protein n=1 Tax=Bacteriovorax sp. BSW11_IV TaxID=1353529 RepID=UPI00038A12DC|nr:AAA family ATPase [Bacteriovorax sp. BSW11_IV]EQC49212.1 CobQ/CobB/MinD/ParA nucleotide binding domain protein [Bacteriovorax sp. BSW11_IV]
MAEQYFTLKKTAEMFGGLHLKERIEELEEQGVLPESKRFRSGALFRKGWDVNEMPLIGEKLGYFKKFDRPLAISVFTTKGGVLKSTLALNIARTAALHGHKVCVVGLDIQGDVTTALGFENDLDNQQDLLEVIEKLNRTKGLSDFFNNQVRLSETIRPTDLSNLFLIPETPELVALNDSLSNINRREFWLKEKVIDALKEHFDLVVMDCSPNWNKLTTNALVACDILVSPLECKINNFRNFKVFRHFLKEFKDEMRLGFENIFIPTRYTKNRKLSLDILEWYRANVEGCTEHGVRENISGEEATALNLSLNEHVPGQEVAKEMRELLKEVHGRIVNYCEFLQNRHVQDNDQAFNYVPPKGEAQRNSWMY